MARRAAHGDGTIRKRSDGRWEGRYSAGYDPATGKQIQKSIYGKTQQEARERLRRAQSEITDGVFIEPSQITLKDWLAVWRKEYCGNTGEQTRILYDYYIALIIQQIGSVKLQKLTPPMAQQMYNQLKLVKGKRKGQAMSAKSVSNIHGFFHMALEQAVNIGYIKANPTSACVLPKKQKPNIQPLDDGQIAQFLTLIQGHPYEAIFIVALFCGMRRGEVIGLTWNDIDFGAGTIYLSRQLLRLQGKDAQYKLAPAKHDKARTITPAGAVMRLLKDCKKRQAEQQLKAGAFWHNPDGLIFTDAVGGPISPKSLYSKFKGLAKQMGCPAARFHDLRHTYAVLSLVNGDDIKTVQENLGHHTAAFTLSTYIHATEKAKKDSAARMDKYIQNVRQNA